MKKILSVCLVSVLAMNAVHAVPVSDVSAKTGWYIGGRLGLSMLNFTVDQSSSEGVSLSDSFSFEPVFGGNVFVGHSFKENYRGEIEAGLVGRFSDPDSGTDFKLTVPYIMANGYYDFDNGWYVGAGLGIAMPATELDGVHLYGGDAKESSISPMFGLMGGWTYKLDSDLLLDLRYRLGGFIGHEHTRTERIVGTEYDITVDTGFVLENSFSVGLRYEF